MNDGPSMLQYVDERLAHTERLFEITQENAKRAVDKAEAAQHAHNVAANEWRGTLNDFKTTLVGRAEYDQLRNDFAAYRLEAARLFAATAGEKAGTKGADESGKWWITTVIAVGSAVAVLVDLFLKR